MGEKNGRALERIVVTGGCGFIGSNFVRHVVREHPGVRVTVIDKLTYAANPASIADLPPERVRLVVGDVCDAALLDRVVPGHDAVIHFAAESHNDNSIADPGAFVRNNVDGTFRLLEACRNPVTNHPSNLSAIIAREIADAHHCEAYIYDAVCVNEVEDIARVTGLADVKRRPFSHVLNTRATARDMAREMGGKYEDMNFIVAHLGGGISINLHRHGRIVDICSDDEGPMSPERAGKLNGKSYVDLCYSGKWSKGEMMKRIKGAGGLVSHLGTASLIEAEEMIDRGDEHADFILSAMAYQIAKEIGALATVAKGRVDCIILTGGCAYSKRLTERVAERVAFIAPVRVVPGSKEMEALCEGVTRVLDGAESYHIYGRD